MATTRTFKDGDELRDAVNECLKNDPTGQSCGMDSWDVSKVDNMSDLFCSHKQFNADISKWDTSSVEDMSGMFGGAIAFNSDISAWDTSSVVDMNYMFAGATSFNADISKWNTSQVYDMQHMFHGATSFNADITKWVTDYIGGGDLNKPIGLNDETGISQMFEEATAWLKTYKRKDGSSSTDGSPNAWVLVAP